MRYNIGPADRTIRAFMGLAMSLLGILRLLKSRRSLALVLMGLGLLAGSLLGYCVSYDLLGISTVKPRFVKAAKDL